jgi:hypothetical protein
MPRETGSGGAAIDQHRPIAGLRKAGFVRDSYTREMRYGRSVPLDIFPLHSVAALARHHRLFDRVHDPPS